MKNTPKRRMRMNIVIIVKNPSVLASFMKT